MIKKDLTGQKFGSLTVKEFSHIKNKNSYWKCECFCGNEKSIRGTSLKLGVTKSCGCKRWEMNLEKRIASKIKICESGCWEWQGSFHTLGYGRIMNNKKRLVVSRVCYELFVNPPGDFLVCHTCDNKKCLNPDHLFLGTHKENSEDCCKKGRRPSVLKNKNIPTIRKLKKYGCKTRVIASFFGVNERAIYDIFSGKTWKHI